MKYDILALGDTVVDAFIRLKDARVTCDINNENCMICMRFGDKIPFEFAEVIYGVGNSANAAVACARLGVNSGLRTYVGNDEDGERCIKALEKNGVHTELIVKQDGKITNYHYVLWFESERTILIKHEVFDYAMPQLDEEPAWIYLSSMADGTLPYHQELGKYLAAHPNVKVAFQPGTFQMKMGTEALAEIYGHTEIFFCNKEESQRILKTETHDIKELLNGLAALGPKLVVITDGREGSYARERDGAMWHAPMYPDPKPPLERTGAGDASASTCVAYLNKGMNLEESLLRGQINSASVVQEIGAQKGLLTPEQIEEWYAKRPADFKASPLA
jgi:sugar/nucleoside kinase (ribokinase family)